MVRARLSYALVNIFTAVNAFKAWLAVTRICINAINTCPAVDAWVVSAFIVVYLTVFAVVPSYASAFVTVDQIVAGAMVRTRLSAALVNVCLAFSAAVPCIAFAFVLVYTVDTLSMV